MVVNLSGALGDSTWLEAGEKPIVSFHCPNDGFAPFENGIVIVPTTGETVVPVSGAKYVIGKSNLLGNHDAMRSAVFNDPYSQAANLRLASNHPLLNLNPDNYEGLYPFLRPTIAAPFQESSPWDFWDSTTVVNTVAAINAATGSSLNGVAIHLNNKGLNPDMSATKARTYIDTIMGYSVPRMIRVMELPGYEQLLSNGAVLDNDSKVIAYPNPSREQVSLRAPIGGALASYRLFDITGKEVASQFAINTKEVTINRNNLTSGLYLVRFETLSGKTGTVQVMFE
jgi:hypothetical protein